jgi:hypothetical protein
MQERINKISEYFKVFNISDNIAYISINFPSKWQIPDTKILEDSFKVKIAPDDGGIVYFFTDVSNGIDNLFDSVEFTITYNRDLETKMQLLKEKVALLKELFAIHSLEELSTLEIKLTPKKAKKTKKVKTTEQTTAVDDVETKVEEKLVEEEDTSFANVNNAQGDINDELSLLEYATQIANENN